MTRNMPFYRGLVRHGKHRLALWVSLLVLALCLMVPGGLPAHIATAQDREKVLTLTLMEGMEYLEDAHLFDEFEEQNPGVTVNVEYIKYDDFIPSASSDLEHHLEKTDAYTLSGDVLITSAGQYFPPIISVEATRAGYYYDLNQAIQMDASFDATKFYPSVWQSANWDGGTWLLPLAAQVFTVLYDPVAFDAAGLPYPTGSWKTADYIHAIEALTVRDEYGRAAVPGFIGDNGSEAMLVYALTGSGFYDKTVPLDPPNFATPELIDFAEQWSTLYESGAIYTGGYQYAEDWQPEQIPLSTSWLWFTINPEESAALLPGDLAGVTIAGFSVSGRTQYPAEAYALAKFLADDIRIADAFTLNFTLVTRAQPVYPKSDVIKDAPYSLSHLSEENQKLMEIAIENAIPSSQVRYFDYFQNSLASGALNGIDVNSALQEAQIMTEAVLREAERQKDQIMGVIPTPAPAVELAPGEISLRFWIDARGYLPNQDLWDEFVTDFVEEDVQVGHLLLETRSRRLEEASKLYDCFYIPYHALSEINTKTLTSLDPLMATDTTFDRDDFLPGTLDQVKGGDQTWAYPLHLQPEVIWYNADGLTQAGVSLPDTAWTVEQFNDALIQLEAFSSGTPAFASARLDTALMMLIAAYGGSPFDYGQTPPEINFTDPENIAAIQQVLDLAKSGLIHYVKLTDPLSHASLETPLYANTLSPFPTSGSNSGGQPTLFPQGQQHAPFSYALGAAYISKRARSAEACYHLITQISQRPDLLLGFSIRYSVGASPDMAAVYGSHEVNFYNQYIALLERPTAINLALQSATPADWIQSYWLLRVFDRYVLENANLETELAEAQRLTADYQACIADVPAMATLDSNRDYYWQLSACASSVDPTSKTFFGS